MRLSLTYKVRFLQLVHAVDKGYKWIVLIFCAVALLVVHSDCTAITAKLDQVSIAVDPNADWFEKMENHLDSVDNDLQAIHTDLSDLSVTVENVN